MLLVSAIIFSLFTGSESATYNDTKTLYNTLFTTLEYDKRILPIQDQKDVLNVSVAFYLDAITEFDEQKESLTTAGTLNLLWKDASLRWEPKDFNETYIIFVPQDDVWKPDISLRNSYSNIKGFGNSYYNARVLFDGYVAWEPFQVLTSSCPVNITYFPFDVQTCKLTFIAWSYSKSEINFIAPSKVVVENFHSSSTWEIVDSDVYFENTHGASVTYTLKLKRKPLFYVLNIILPVIMLSVLSVVTFLLPVKSGERASYSVTVFLSLAVFLTIVASEIPKNSETVSLLSVYLVLMITLSTLYVLVSVVELRIWNKDEEEVNHCCLRMYTFVEILRCKRKCRPQKISDSQASIEKPETRTNVTWPDIIDAMDFLFFWFGSSVTFLSTVVLLAMLSIGE